jgi:hypothetical protein
MTEMTRGALKELIDSLPIGEDDVIWFTGSRACWRLCWLSKALGGMKFQVDFPDQDDYDRPEEADA